MAKRPLQSTAVHPAPSRVVRTHAGTLPPVPTDVSTQRIRNGKNEPEISLDCGAILSERYELQTLLGTGAYGDVYTAWDQKRGGTVAIKVLRNAQANALMQFKQEFRGLFELKHPNLVRVFKLGRDGDFWFIVMEYIDGSPITAAAPIARGKSSTSDLTQKATTPLTPNNNPDPAYITAAEARMSIQPETLQPALPAQSIRNRIGQLCQGVYTLHHFGILHCDLKPSNVMLDRTGRVVILDFGASRYTASLGEHYRHHWVRAGTRAYMAPEARSLRESTTGLDWYAAGMMLAEMLTGLTARIFASLLHEERRSVLSAIAARHPAYKELCTLCIELLEPDPKLRANHHQILHTCYGDDAAHIDRRTQSFLHVFSGRFQEFSALEDAYQQFMAGRPYTLLIEGAAGSGKRSLCEEFLRHISAQDPSLHILVAHCAHDELLNFRAFDELVDGLCALLRKLPADELAPILPLCTPALCALFPTLRTVHPDLKESRVLSPPEDALYALQYLLLHVAKRHRLLIWLSDIDQADRDSMRWIARIFAPGARPNAFLLLSKTNDHVSAQDEAIDIDTLGYAIPTVRLQAVNEKLARAAIEYWLPEDIENRTDTIDTIVQVSGGNLQLMRTLCHRRDLLKDLPATLSIETLTERRLAQLSADALYVLQVLSVSFEPIDIRFIAFVAKRHSTDVDKLVRILHENAFVTEHLIDQTERYAVIDESTRQYLQHSLGETRVQELHEQYAYAITRGDFHPLRPNSVIAHLTQAGLSQTAERYAQEFATAADQGGAYDSAAQMYEVLATLRKEQDKADELDLQMRIIDCKTQSGHLLDAARALAALADNAQTINDSAALHQRAAELFTLCGYSREAAEQHELARQKHPGHTARYLPRLASILLLLNRLKRRIELFELESTSNAPLDAHTLNRLRTHRMAGFEIGIVDPVSGLEFALRELDLALNVGSRKDISRALAGLATFVSAMGEKYRTLAYDWGKLAEELAAYDNDPISIEWARVGQASINYHQSNYREAWERMYRSFHWLQQHASQQSLMLSYCSTHLVYLAYMTGRVQTLRSIYYAQIVEARARNNRMSEATITFSGFMTWLIDDAPAAARAALKRIYIPKTQRLYRLQDFFMQQYAAELALYEQRTEEYSEHLQALKAYERTVVSRSMELTRHAARFLRGRLLLAKARERALSNKEAHQLERLARALCKDNTALVRGWGHQLFAGSAMLNGDRNQAIKLLQQTITAYDHAGITLYAEVLRTTLSASGLVPHNDDPYQNLYELGIVHPERFVRAHLSLS